MRIDTHNHGVPEETVELLARDRTYGIEVADGQIRGRQFAIAINRSFTDADAKLSDLKRIGLDAAVVSVAPLLLGYEFEAAAGEALAESINRGLAAFARRGGGTLKWMANVPLQAPDRAAAVLIRAAEDGCVGVQVGTSVAGCALDTAGLDPVWSEAEGRSLPILIHPSYVPALPELDAYYLRNVIGNPLETTVAIERLLCAGVLDRYPGLRFVLAHAGGFFPYQAGRLRHARTVRPELRDSPMDPWQYRGRIVVDTITHDTQALKYVIGQMGAENVVMGTDMPFDMASPEPMRQLEAAIADPDTVRQVAERNPAGLYGFGS